MVAGHLREQNGRYQMILNWTGHDGKRKSKSISTGLTVKGNKRRAEEMLRVACQQYNPENAIENADMLLSSFLDKWLKDKANLFGPTRYAQYAYNAKSSISPYFDQEKIKLLDCTPEVLKLYFSHERTENRVGVQTLLERHETLISAFAYGVELGWLTSNPAEKVNPCEDESKIIFTDFIVEWLEIMRTSLAVTTYSGYKKTIKNQIVPYFNEHYPGLRLANLTPKHIQDYYTYELTVKKLSPNTVLRRQANIRKALQYAYKTGLIPGNPADKIERPKAEKFTGTFYQMEELDNLFQIFAGDPMELPVIFATFYGLRRSEIIGLKWDAINFKQKTITIGHTVHQVKIDGKTTMIAQDRTKTKSSFRTLPLVGPIEGLLLAEKARQEENRRLCGNCYCTIFEDYIFVNAIGELIKPDYISGHFARMIKKYNLRKLRFHDLRHSCASLLFANGVSLKEIQAWLGHSTLGTTANIYTHMDENKKISSAVAIMPLLACKKTSPGLLNAGPEMG